MFREHDYFGLGEDGVIFFPQDTLPSLSKEGKIIIGSKGKVAKNPNGNGGMYLAL